MSLRPPKSCKVYTPPELAAGMVDALLTSSKQKWLEPGCGQGVFLRALDKAGVGKKLIHAVDLEPNPATSDALGTVERGVDFLQWAVHRPKRFDCIVGNPPYLSIRGLPEPLLSRAASVQDSRGTSIGMRANTWYAFLLTSVRLLKPGGSLAFVLPAACEYADYCKPGREGVTRLFERTDLIRSQRPLFNGVQEGAAILVLRKKGSSAGLFRRHEVKSLDDAVNCLENLDAKKARTCPQPSRETPASTARMGDVMRVRLGGVTGDAKYFVFSESHRRLHGLPIASVRPVLTRSRHIYQAHVNESHWRELREEDERTWLFDPRPAVVKHPAVRRYLRLAPKNGGCHRDRYKILNRAPWYRTPLLASPHGFISGMSSCGVWMCLNEMPRLNATNTLYVVHFDAELSRTRRYAWALCLLTTRVSKAINRSTRVYADGLRKIEPGQLANVPLPTPPAIRNAVSIYRAAVEALLNGDICKSREVADEAIFGER